MLYNQFIINLISIHYQLNRRYDDHNGDDNKDDHKDDQPPKKS